MKPRLRDTRVVTFDEDAGDLERGPEAQLSGSRWNTRSLRPLPNGTGLAHIAKVGEQLGSEDSTEVLNEFRYFRTDRSLERAQTRSRVRDRHAPSLALCQLESHPQSHISRLIRFRRE